MIYNLIIILNKYFGAVAQLGERIAGSDEVRGSIPLSSTKIKILYFLFYKKQYNLKKLRLRRKLLNLMYLKLEILRKLIAKLNSYQYGK